MRNAMWVGGGITGMGEIPLLGVKEKGIAKVIRDIFRNGEQGFFYDPSDMGTLFQDSGLTPLTSAIQPVGMMLDKSKGLPEGLEVFNTIDLSDGAGWSTSGVVIDRTSNQFTTSGVGGVLYRIAEGKSYKITMKGHSTAPFRIRNSSSNPSGLDPIPAGDFDIVGYPVAILLNNVYLFLQLQAAGVFTLEHLSLKEIPGNHAYQNTSAARPILQSNPSRIAYDGIDDKLITNLPAQLNNCTIFRAIPNVGTQVKYNQTLPMLYEDSTNHSGLVAIDRALTRKEQLRLMIELDKKAGATSLDTLTFKTFDNNQEGFVYDPNDLSTMYQDSAGTIPVTAAGQPVGLILDKSKGLRVGANLVPQETFSEGITGWSLQSGWTFTGGKVSCKGGTSLLFKDTKFVLGKRYRITIVATRSSTEGTLSIRNGSSAASAIATTQATGIEVIERNVHVSDSTEYIYFFSQGWVGEISSIRIEEILGNHAYQTTSASRPILRQNTSTGAYYLEFDGADDFLKTSNIDFTATDEISLFTGMYPSNKGFQGLLHFGTSNNQPQSLYLNVDTNRSLSFYAGGSQLASVLNVRGTAPSVYVAKSKISTQYILLKSNGVSQVGTGSLGAGNLGNYPLTMGARQDMIHLLKGDFYGLIGIGKLVSDNETAAIEKELAKRTGVTLNV